jgi:hypothetical protein
MVGRAYVREIAGVRVIRGGLRKRSLPDHPIGARPG